MGKRISTIINRFLVLGLVFVFTQNAISAKTKNIEDKLTIFLAEGEGNAPAVIVCPGGSYSWLDWETEGIGVAKWLQSQGVSAFVLKYRVQGVPAFITHYRLIVRGHQYPDAFNDIEEAILFIRRNAKKYGIDPNRLGCMGFSAGGHLVASAGMYYKTDSLRPDFVAPIYPVVTLQEKPFVHKRSRRALLGEYRKYSQRWRDSLSLEKHVRPDMPPVFLMNCIDDPIVHYHNSELLDSALNANSIKHEYHQYKTGGHGFGANPQKASKECIVWRDEFLRWFKAL